MLNRGGTCGCLCACSRMGHVSLCGIQWATVGVAGARAGLTASELLPSRARSPQNEGMSVSLAPPVVAASSSVREKKKVASICRRLCLESQLAVWCLLGFCVLEHSSIWSSFNAHPDPEHPPPSAMTPKNKKEKKSFTIFDWIWLPV